MIKVALQTIVERFDAGLVGDIIIERSDHSVMRGPVRRAFITHDGDFVVETIWTAWRIAPFLEWMRDDQEMFVVDCDTIPYFNKKGGIRFSIAHVGEVLIEVSQM